MRIDFSGPRIQNSDPGDPGTGIFDLRLDRKISEIIKLHKIRDFLLLGYSGEFGTLVSWNGTFWKISNFDLCWKWGYGQTFNTFDFRLFVFRLRKLTINIVIFFLKLFSWKKRAFLPFWLDPINLFVNLFGQFYLFSTNCCEIRKDLIRKFFLVYRKKVCIICCKRMSF